MRLPHPFGSLVIRHWSFVIPSLWLGSLWLNAADYHISPAGSDSANGLTPATAWQTIAKVNTTTFAPGDRILFEGGQSFSGNLDFSDESGTATQPITVASYGTGRATIQAGNGSGIVVYNRAGFVIRDLVIAGSGGATNNGFGVLFYADLVGNVKLPHVRLDNLEVYGFRNGGIELGAWPGDGSKTGYTDVKITRSISRDNVRHGIQIYGHQTNYTGGPVTYAHSDITIADTRSYNNVGLPNTGNHSGNGIVLSNVNGVLIERCVAFNNGQNSNFPGAGPVGIWVYNTANALIQFNESYNNRTSTIDGGGFDLDGGSVNCVLQYNYSHGNDGPGFLLYQFPGAQPHRDNIVRYNLSQNDSVKGYLGGIAVGGVLTRAQIYHNTVHTSSRAVHLLSGASDIAFRNNVLITTGGTRLIDVPAGLSGLVFQGNAYWASGSAFTFRDSGVNYTSLAAWRTATGRELNGTTPTGLDSDPQLLNPGNAPTLGDPALLSSLTHYRPAPTSPLIDAGLDLAQAPWNLAIGTRDFPGIPLPTGARPDIGAFELPASPYQAWRIENLGALPAGVTLAQDAADDFDGDGLSQLLEYAFDLDPRVADSSPPPLFASTSSSPLNSHLQVSFPRVPAATDLTYTVLASTDLANPSAWQPIAQGAAGAPLAPVLDRATVSETGATLRSVTVLDAAPLATTPRRFLRLEVTRPD